MNLTPWRKPQIEERSESPLSFDEWVSMISSFSYAGVRYTLPGAKQEEIGGNYSSLAQAAYKSNGVVFACMLVRMFVFSEARFQWRQFTNGRSGPLFGTPELRPLEIPWTNGTTLVIGFASPPWSSDSSADSSEET